MKEIALQPILRASERVWSLDVHPDLTLVASGVELGNTDERFVPEGSPEPRANRLKLLGFSGCDKLVHLKTACGADFTDVDDFNIRDTELEIPGDGFVTSRQRLGMMLKAADCAPLTMYHPEKGVLGFAHIGRDGASLGLAPAMLQYMRSQFGVQAKGIHAHFGPAIAPESFVMEELRGVLTDLSWKPHLISAEGGHGVDFISHTAMQLIRQGVQSAKITRTAGDNRRNPDFFSHIAFQAGEQPPGRNGFIAGIAA